MAVLSTIYDVESNINTTVKGSYSPTETSGIQINKTLNITKGVLKFETNGEIEYASFGGTSVSNGITTLIDVVRGLSTTANDFSGTGTGISLVSGVTKVTLVNYHALFNLKANTSGDNTFSGNQTIASTNRMYFFDTNNYIYSDGTNLFLRSNSQAEITLASLASLSGSNDKTKVTASDTTEDYLNTKLTAGTGLGKTITNPAANEGLTFNIDLTDTNAFVETTAGVGDAGKGVILNANGLIDGANVDTASLTVQKNTLPVEYGETIAQYDCVSIDENKEFFITDPTDITSSRNLMGIAQEAGVDGNTRNITPFGQVQQINTLAVGANSRRVDSSEQNVSTNADFDLTSASVWKGQTFDTEATQTNISGFKVYLNATGTLTSASTDIFIELYAVDGSNLPTGSALASASKPVNDVLANGAGVYTFEFTPVTVTASTKYAMVARVDGFDGSNYVSIFYRNTSVYANGNGVTSSNSGSTWTNELSNDYYFIPLYKTNYGLALSVQTDGSIDIATNGMSEDIIGYAIDDNQVVVDRKLRPVSGTLSGTLPAVNYGSSGSRTIEITYQIELKGVPVRIDYYGTMSGGVAFGDSILASKCWLYNNIGWYVLDDNDIGGNVDYDQIVYTNSLYMYVNRDSGGIDWRWSLDSYGVTGNILSFTFLGETFSHPSIDDAPFTINYTVYY